MNSQKILRQPFDTKTHKKHFTNYLEVVLLEDGTVVYATPSHQEKLISIALEKLNTTRESLNKLCPIEYYLDFMVWLVKITNCVAVYGNGFIGKPNKLQLNALNELQKEGLYTGKTI